MPDDNPYQPPASESADAGEGGAIVRWLLAFLAAFGVFWIAVVLCAAVMMLLDHWVNRVETLAETDTPALALAVAELYVNYWPIIPLVALCASFAFFLRLFRRRRRLRRSSRN